MQKFTLEVVAINALLSGSWALAISIRHPLVTPKNAANQALTTPNVWFSAMT